MQLFFFIFFSISFGEELEYNSIPVGFERTGKNKLSDPRPEVSGPEAIEERNEGSGGKPFHPNDLVDPNEYKNQLNDLNQINNHMINYFNRFFAPEAPADDKMCQRDIYK